MTHIAMFDAINAIEREFEPYRVRLRCGRRIAGGRGGAGRARRARRHQPAAHRPPTMRRSRASSATHPSGFVRRGAAVGARVAEEILAWRQNDGWVVSPFPPYAEPPLPGRWQPTPPNNAAAAFTHLQHAAPMALLTPTQYLPPPPPSLTSARYAADFNEVKLIGKSDSATRTRRADGDRAALGRHRHDRRRHGHQLLRRSGTTSRATWHASASCRWSRRRGCSRS